MLGALIIGVIVLAVVLLPITALIDVMNTNFQGNDKLIWVLIILFMPIIGSLLYFIVERPKHRNNRY